MPKLFKSVFFATIYFFTSLIISQSLTNLNVKSYSSTEIYQSLKKLNVLGSVLYIAAHPDDENTSVISYMSNGMHLRTAYMSLTRGDGGQNLLGSEKGDLLGVLRTNELISARKVDGGIQYFSRAIDFGYSKTADETLSKWDSTLILYDIVKVIREFRPDIIITRFSSTQGGHGHHLASAILAKEAFYKAADSTIFPDQLNKLDVWQAKRIVWDSWKPYSDAVTIDVGQYNPILGKSYTEIAAESRSNHKSQGFGVSPWRQSYISKFNHTAGTKAKKSIFDNIDFTWNRVVNSKNIKNLISNIINSYKFNAPDKSIGDLIKLYKTLDSEPNSFWIIIKKEEVKNLIIRCAGIWIEFNSDKAFYNHNNVVKITGEMVNRSPLPVELESYSFNSEKIKPYKKSLSYNKQLVVTDSIYITSKYSYSQPYWLRNKSNGFVFNVDDMQLIGKGVNSPILVANTKLKMVNHILEYHFPVKFRWNDAVAGEKTRDIKIVPKISLKLDNSNYIFINSKSKNINVTISNLNTASTGSLSLSVPNGWGVSTNKIPFSLTEKNEAKTFSFTVFPSESATSGTLTAIAKIGNREYNQELIEIDYPHIEPQIVLKNSEAKLIKLDALIPKVNIAYIMGSGDEIPAALSQFGLNISLLNDRDIIESNFSKFDVIICGVRAFNTRNILTAQQNKFIEYVKNGGTWIVQHNTRFGTQVEEICGFKIHAKGKSRITEEDATINILNPNHSIFNYPNKITQNDFNNWVSERGTYLAESWDSHLTPLLSGHDKNEADQLGGLLYANVGKGVFIYTAFSWFRQLPAGVPGAYRLFLNLISVKGKK